MTKRQITRIENLKTTNKRKRTRSSSKDSKIKTKTNLRSSPKSSNPGSRTRTMTTVRSARKASAEKEFSTYGVNDKKQSKHIKKVESGKRQKRTKSISSPKRSQRRKAEIKK